jgi:hypothetical protein
MSQADSIRRVAPDHVRGLPERVLGHCVVASRVAEYLSEDDLGVTGPDYVDTLSKVAQYLGNKGFLQRQSDEWGLFSITARGISEVEEDPALQ